MKLAVGALNPGFIIINGLKWIQLEFLEIFQRKFQLQIKTTNTNSHHTYKEEINLIDLHFISMKEICLSLTKSYSMQT